MVIDESLVDPDVQLSNITALEKSKFGLDVNGNVIVKNESREDGFVSIVNSSTALLLAGATFTGPAEDVSQYSSVTVFVESDVDSANMGFYVQFSINGVDNWFAIKNHTIQDDDTHRHNLAIFAQYFRIKYTNGTTNQGEFRLQTIFHKHKTPVLTEDNSDPIQKHEDVTLMRITNDSLLDISRDLHADKFSFHRFGDNKVVPNGSFADIWSYGPTDPIYNWPVTAETFRIQSGGDAADDAAGLGARTVVIIYLDAIGDLQNDILTTAGALASDETSVTATRFIRAWVVDCGTIKGNNTGQILFENSTTNEIVGVIEAGEGQTEMSMYTVPLNYTAYLSRITIDVAAGANKDADIIIV